MNFVVADVIRTNRRRLGKKERQVGSRRIQLCRYFRSKAFAFSEITGSSHRDYRAYTAAAGEQARIYTGDVSIQAVPLNSRQSKQLYDSQRSP